MKEIDDTQIQPYPRYPTGSRESVASFILRFMAHEKAQKDGNGPEETDMAHVVEGSIPEQMFPRR